MPDYCFTCATALGWLAIVASAEGLLSLSWPAESAYAAVTSLGPLGAAASPSEPGADWQGLLDRLQAYFAGERVAFDREPIDWRGVPPFRRRVWAAVQSIPWGVTRSYGQVAAALGAPRAARAVGGAMAANRLPIIVPCHRVLGADGRLVGFAAGLSMKARLLSLEGVSPNL